MSRSLRSFAIALTLVATGVTTSQLAFADEGTSSDSTETPAPKPHHHHHTETPKAAETPAASATTAAAEAPAPAATQAPAAPATSAQTAAPATTAAPESKPLVLRETAASAQPSHGVSLMADPAQGASWKIVGILGAMCAAAWVFKKKQEKNKPAETIKSLQVLKKLSVGVRSELLVVDVDGQRLLIGVTPSTITTLASIPEVELENAMMDAEAVERAIAQKTQPQSQGHDLGDRFAALVEGSRTTSGSVMARNPTLPRESGSRELIGEPKRLQMPSQSQAIRRRSSASITQRPTTNDEELEGQARGLAQRFGKTGSRA